MDLPYWLKEQKIFAIIDVPSIHIKYPITVNRIVIQSTMYQKEETKSTKAVI